MKRSISVFLLLFVLCSVAHANVCGQRIVLNISAGTDACLEPASCAAQYPGQLSSNCTGALNSAASAVCVCVYDVCCDDTVTSYEDTVFHVGTYSVDTGDFASAAQQLFDTYVGPLNLPDPQPGFVRTGEMEGYVYDAYQGLDTGQIDFAGWKRGYYNKPGDATQIEPIPSGGSGGSGGGSTGGGLTQSQVEQAVEQALENKIGSMPGDTPDAYTYPPVEGYQITDEIVDSTSITDLLTNFLSSNPIVQVLGGFRVDADPAGSCNNTVSLFGGNVSIDFSNSSVVNALSLMGSLFVVVAGIYSFFIIFGRA